MRRNYQGFTLIELLVVISIIALLIGILLPALGLARETARTNVCLSNSRQMGLAVNQYSTEFQDAIPDGYYYKTSASFNQAFPSDWKEMAQLEMVAGESVNGPTRGYAHWSGTLIGLGYLQDSNGLVCPTSPTGGWGPTFYNDQVGTARTGYGQIKDLEGYLQGSSSRTAWTQNGTSFGGGVVSSLGSAPSGADFTTAYTGQVDAHASRLSYIPNEALMGRGKYRAVFDGNLLGGVAAGKANVVYAKASSVDKAAGTIVFAETTDSARQFYDTSSSSGNNLKVHRPTHAVLVATSAGAPVRRYDGENWLYNAGTGAATTTGKVNATDIVQALPVDAYTNIANAFKANPTQTNQNISMPAFSSGGPTNIRPFLAYTSPDRHGGQANYTYADGHATAKKLVDTMNPADWQWGLKMYSNAERPEVYAPGSGTIKVY